MEIDLYLIFNIPKKSLFQCAFVPIISSLCSSWRLSTNKFAFSPLCHNLYRICMHIIISFSWTEFTEVEPNGYFYWKMHGCNYKSRQKVWWKERSHGNRGYIFHFFATMNRTWYSKLYTWYPIIKMGVTICGQVTGIDMIIKGRFLKGILYWS